jgi:hypothetical protein
MVSEVKEFEAFSNVYMGNRTAVEMRAGDLMTLTKNNAHVRQLQPLLAVRSAGRGRGVTFYFVCDDANAMYAELSSRGLKLDPPRMAHYGMNQLFVPEPNGYALCFESAVSNSPE